MANLKVENDNRKQVLNELEDSVKKALLAVGLEASSDVAKACPVDTGLLHNSITYAVSGGSPSISSYTSNDESTSGTYRGKAPNDKIPAVYIGTNVEYAKYVQFGTSNSKRKKTDFMFAPIRAKIKRYKEIMERYLKQG